MNRVREKPVVACVDDDPAVLRALYRELACEEFRVWLTTRPERMLGWIEAGVVGLMVTDQRMPRGDGTHLLKAVARHSPETPSVVLTAYPEEVGPGPRCVLTKPWKGDRLRRIIHDLIETGEGDRTGSSKSEGGA